MQPQRRATLPEISVGAPSPIPPKSQSRLREQVDGSDGEHSGHDADDLAALQPPPSPRNRTSTLRYSSILDMLDDYTDMISIYDAQLAEGDAADGHGEGMPHSPSFPRHSIPRLASIEAEMNVKRVDLSLVPSDSDYSLDGDGEDDPELNEALREVEAVLTSVFSPITADPFECDAHSKSLAKDGLSDDGMYAATELSYDVTDSSVSPAQSLATDVKAKPQPQPKNECEALPPPPEIGCIRRPSTPQIPPPKPPPLAHIMAMPLPPVPRDLNDETIIPPEYSYPPPNYAYSRKTSGATSLSSMSQSSSITSPQPPPRPKPSPLAGPTYISRHDELPRRGSATPSLASATATYARKYSHPAVKPISPPTSFSKPPNSSANLTPSQKITIHARSTTYSAFLQRERLYILALRRLCESYVYPFRAYALQHASRGSTRKGSLAQQINTRFRDMLSAASSASSAGDGSSSSRKTAITPSQVEDIFGNVEEILAVHKKVLRTMETKEESVHGEEWTLSTGISGELAQLIPLMQLYAAYVHNHAKALSVLDQLTAESPAFRKLLDGCRERSAVQPVSEPSVDDTVATVFGASPLKTARRLSTTSNGSESSVASRARRLSIASTRRSSVVEAGEDLLTLLSQPLQRAVQYHMFLDKWMKDSIPMGHPDRAMMDTVWTQFKVASFSVMHGYGTILRTFMNDLLRISEVHNTLRVLELRQAMLDMPRSVPGPGSVLLHLGIQCQVGTTSGRSLSLTGGTINSLAAPPAGIEEPRLCVLFSDTLIWGRENHGEWQYLSHLPLRGAFVTPLSNTYDRRWCWRIAGPRDSRRALVLTAKSEEERHDWMTRVCAAIQQLVKAV